MDWLRADYIAQGLCSRCGHDRDTPLRLCLGCRRDSWSRAISGLSGLDRSYLVRIAKNHVQHIRDQSSAIISTAAFVYLRQWILGRLAEQFSLSKAARKNTTRRRRTVAVQKRRVLAPMSVLVARASVAAPLRRIVQDGWFVSQCWLDDTSGEP